VLLHEITAAAEHAVQQARIHPQAGAAAVRAELARLDGLRRRVESLRRYPPGGGRLPMERQERTWTTLAETAFERRVAASIATLEIDPGARGPGRARRP
jgi:hypothetical protein